MYEKHTRHHLRIVMTTLIVSFAACLLLSPRPTIAGEEKADASKPKPVKQKYFTTPEAAADAMIKAFKKNDESALLDIFGHEHKKLVVVTDKVAQKESRRRLSEAAKQKLKLEKQGQSKVIVVVGLLEWPLPIPIVKENRGWRFDTAAGVEEILNRRIGKNELIAMTTCREVAAAQLEYAGKDRDGDEVLEYAQRIVSTKGNRDGLYWYAGPDDNEDISPLGPIFADAAVYLEAGKKAKGKIPYKGYYYKILTRQGENVPGRKYDYVINGNMIAGFALVACPADYEASGIMTFVISHQGKVYEKALGEKTLDIVKAMKEYNPDKTWKLTEEE